MQHNPSTIPNHLAQTAQGDSDRVEPSTPFESKPKVDEERDCEEGKEGGVGRNGRAIGVDAVLWGAES